MSFAARALRHAAALARKPVTRITELVSRLDPTRGDGILMDILRPARKGMSRRMVLEKRLRLGRNCVHAMITHRDGTITDLGFSHNLLTNIGRDVYHDWTGGRIYTQNGPATATSATSVTGTGSTWTASNLATPQLGLVGARVHMPVTGLTTAPVYGNIVSNTTSVITVDKWWNAADGTGTTPASTSGLIIGSGGLASVRFMALTADVGAASASDTTLAGEITTNGLGRALATYAHTYGASTQTLQKAFSPSGTQTGIVKMGLFCCLSSAGADPVIFESTFTSASVVSGDSLTVTDTITISG
jgi:hypothetical protein